MTLNLGTNSPLRLPGFGARYRAFAGSSRLVGQPLGSAEHQFCHIDIIRQHSRSARLDHRPSHSVHTEKVRQI